MCICMSFRSAVGHGELRCTQWRSDAVALAHSVGIEESCPRIASYQLHRSSIPAVNARQYYRRTPMLDHLITEIDNRFEEAAAGIVGELAQILPSELVSSSVQLNPSHFKEVLQLLTAIS